jgi:crossover junction endodeoxyribonuclease RuvC
MKILGIDPGLRRTGWGVIGYERGRLSFVAAGVIAPPEGAPLARRLLALHEGVQEVIARHAPQVAAIEESFVSVNAASTLKLGNARGALLLSLAVAGMPVHEYAALLVKKTVVGVGRAEKAQVAMMVRTLLPLCDAAGADALDALAVAICHAHHRREAA